MAGVGDGKATAEECKARVIIEKKTVINLVEAFGVAVKHYLRGEEGVYYVDLYHLVKFLPSYALPAGFPSTLDVASVGSGGEPPMPRVSNGHEQNGNGNTHGQIPTRRSAVSIRISTDPAGAPSVASPRTPANASASANFGVPVPATSPRRTTTFALGPGTNERKKTFDMEKGSIGQGYAGDAEGFLLPAQMPPKYHLLDLFPLSLVVKALTKRGKEVKVRPSIHPSSHSFTHFIPIHSFIHLPDHSVLAFSSLFALRSAFCVGYTGLLITSRSIARASVRAEMI